MKASEWAAFFNGINATFGDIDVEFIENNTNQAVLQPFVLLGLDISTQNTANPNAAVVLRMDRNLTAPQFLSGLQPPAST